MLEARGGSSKHKNETKSISGPFGVINLINHHVIGEKRTPVEASLFIIRKTTDDYVKNYFTALGLELSSREFN